MSRTILRRRSVEAKTGLSRSSIYRMIEAGKFPSPVRLGKRAVGWDSIAVQAWIDDLVDHPSRENPE